MFTITTGPLLLSLDSPFKGTVSAHITFKKFSKSRIRKILFTAHAWFSYFLPLPLCNRVGRGFVPFNRDPSWPSHLVPPPPPPQWQQLACCAVRDGVDRHIESSAGSVCQNAVSAMADSDLDDAAWSPPLSRQNAATGRAASLRIDALAAALPAHRTRVSL
jgi:hypothetical protein